MATTVTLPATPRREPVPRYETGLWSWLTTVDHKRIGTLYLFTSLFLFLVGGLEAGIMRRQLEGTRTASSYRPRCSTSCSRCTARR